jgi:3-oxoacyl-[acyl-carrier protein] reductase
MMNFRNHTVLITGASSGIGKEIALSFGSKGANVIVNYLSNEEVARNVVSHIENLGGNAIAIRADVSSLEQCDEMVKTAISHFGGIDTLINNSGITRDNLLMRMKESDFDSVINVNLKGTWNMCKATVRSFMKKRAGSIINISSVVGQIGNAGQSNYVASKAGVIGLTKSLSKEFGSRGVRVNAVAPGFIETKMTDSLPKDVKDSYLKQIPLGLFGTPRCCECVCVFSG